MQGKTIKEGKRAIVKVTIRPCHSIEEYKECAALQKKIWGHAWHEVYPARLFVVIHGMGGQVLGAFAPRHRLIGFVASMPAWRGAQRYFHSLIMGVLPSFQNQGVAKALKWEQRRQAVQLGIDCIQWTFDPLRTKNAFLNIERLGAVARRYQPDYYGNIDSRSQRGLPSDRLICEWWLKSSRVRRAMKGGRPRMQPDNAGARVVLPADAWMLASSDPQKVKETQLKIRRQLLAYFRRGYVITGFSPGHPQCAYLLDRLPSTGKASSTLPAMSFV